MSTAYLCAGCREQHPAAITIRFHNAALDPSPVSAHYCAGCHLAAAERIHGIAESDALTLDEVVDVRSADERLAWVEGVGTCLLPRLTVCKAVAS